MERKLSHYGERGTWAPFVGVALAALTIGSLVLFSVIAQRTAGGAFVSGGVTAHSPAQQAARSITVATGAGGGGSVVASERTVAELPGAPSATPELLEADPSATAEAPVLATFDDPGTTASEGDTDAGATVATTSDLRPFFRMGAGGPDNGGVYAANRGKNANGEGKAKGKKDSKDRKDAKNKTKNKTKNAKGHSKPERNDNSEGHRRSGNAGSSRAAAPARSSRSAASSRPASKGTPASNHANGHGKGHSKGRGRGHRH